MILIYKTHVSFLNGLLGFFFIKREYNMEANLIKIYLIKKKLI